MTEVTTPERKPNFFRKHKVLTVILAILGLFIIIGAASGGSKDKASQTPSTATQSTSTTQAAVPAPAATTPKVVLSNETFKDIGYGMYGVDGEFKNNDTVKHSATIKATFYDATGKIMGTAIGAVNDVEPGDTKTYSLSGNDQVSGYATMKVQVDTLL